MISSDIIQMNSSEVQKENINKHFPTNVSVYTSTASFQGKTSKIVEKAKDNYLITLFLVGDLSPNSLLERLMALDKSMQAFQRDTIQQEITLHIKLDITDSSEQYLNTLDQILFQLLFNRCISMGNGYLFLDQVNYFEIEISNTVKKQVVENMGVFELLRQGYKKSQILIEGIQEEAINMNLLLKKIPDL